MQTNELFPVWIVGTGRAATGVAMAFAQAGISVQMLSRTKQEPIGGIPCHRLDQLDALPRTRPIMIIGTPDRYITDMASQILQYLPERVLPQAIGHLSGSLPAAAVLSEHVQCPVFSAHPMLSFAPTAPPLPMPQGSFVTLQGDEEAVTLLIPLFQAAGARVFPIREEDKSVCHAACVLSANLPAALLSLASTVFESCGIPNADLASLQLLHSMSDNLIRAQTPSAVTGPFARGDIQTVAMNLQALQSRSNNAATVYSLLGTILVKLLAKKHQIPEETCQTITNLLNLHHPSPKGPLGK